MISQKWNNPGSEDWSQVHGGFSNNTNTEQDGIPHNAYSAFQPPQEMLKEVNFVALNAPAEYRAATTISGISKSGTNRPHGEVFTNFNHDRLNALSVGVHKRPKPKTGGHRESYSLSGPVFIPKLYDGQNKTFFHVLYQGLSDTSTSLRRGYIAPTLKMREGDFSEFAAATGKNIVDPFTGSRSLTTSSPACELVRSGTE
ncbi:MAG: hypothetical protein EXQ58_03855 [Acidobacteria bacterium]|nr:hypothetical protein [Acidobacteriota bacterium]